MKDESLEAGMEELGREVAKELAEWRKQNSKATLAQIERAVTQITARGRARMIERLVGADEEADVRQAVCPHCGAKAFSKGREARRLTGEAENELTIERTRFWCPACQAGFSPLDRALEIGPERLTPHLLDGLTWLGARLPFGEAAETMTFMGTQVSPSTVRRWTERTGATMVEIQDERVTKIEREAPEAPAGAETMQMSVDGTFVGVVGGDWTEVKTTAIGEVVLEEDAEGTTRARRLTYFSRRAEASDFTRAALVEVQARGIERAGRVAGPSDGALWIQGVYDHHRPDTVRILDFRHAGDALARAAKGAFGETSPKSRQWTEAARGCLRREGPAKVLKALELLRTQAGERRGSEAVQIVQGQAEYLRDRNEMLRYPEFEQAGLPIRSGAVESANKLVIEARMKGAGMRWAFENITPMATVRTMIKNGRWEQEFAQVKEQWRARRRKIEQISFEYTKAMW